MFAEADDYQHEATSTNAGRASRRRVYHGRYGAAAMPPAKLMAILAAHRHSRVLCKLSVGSGPSFNAGDIVEIGPIQGTFDVRHKKASSDPVLELHGEVVQHRVMRGVTRLVSTT
jgi:hypothetical protein